MSSIIKQIIVIILISFSVFVNAQETITVNKKDVITLDADTFVGVTMFDELFYIKNSTVFKQTNTQTFSYQNLLLGDAKSVGILNPLQTTLFYNDFNVFVQLDKKLGEISRLDFNASLNFSSVGYVATTSNKRLWVFNTDTQQIQVYNPIHDTIDVTTTPVQEQVIQFYSNYNFCWILTDTKLLQFNVYGNLLNTYELLGYDNFIYNANHFVLKKEGELFLLSTEEVKPKKIILPEIPIKEFSVTNETLYIYTGKEVYSFAINLKQTD